MCLVVFSLPTASPIFSEERRGAEPILVAFGLCDRFGALEFDLKEILFAGRPAMVTAGEGLRDL